MCPAKNAGSVIREEEVDGHLDKQLALFATHASYPLYLVFSLKTTYVISRNSLFFIYLFLLLK